MLLLLLMLIMQTKSMMLLMMKETIENQRNFSDSTAHHVANAREVSPLQRFCNQQTTNWLVMLDLLPTLKQRVADFGRCRLRQEDGSTHARLMGCEMLKESKATIDAGQRPVLLAESKSHQNCLNFAIQTTSRRL